MDPENKCDICGKAFKLRRNLYEHQRKVHKVDVVTKHKISCPICQKVSSTTAKLRDHVRDEHDIDVQSEVMVFENFNTFIEWKEQLEKKENVLFRLQRSSTTKAGKKTYYACHRSNFNIKGNAAPSMRETKVQGSCKINGYCTAALDCCEADIITVTYFKTHVGHDIELKHLPLHKLDKKPLIAKLAEGASMDKVLNEVRSSLGDTLERVHLTTKQDLRNMANASQISHPERLHSNDAHSVRLFVEQMESLGDDSPVLFFKDQNAVMEGFANSDFMLVLMTPGQVEMLQSFGDKKICIDTTHGTNAYDFNLTTLLVVDEFNSGFPVAFCISKKLDAHQMEQFVSSIFLKAGKISAKIFMADDAPVYYNAWCRVMGTAEKQLLCTWHVDRSWRSNLNKIRSLSKRRQVYETARTLLECLDEKKFHDTMKRFLNDLENDDDTKSFYFYFKNHYANRPELWGYCFRLQSGINTNMYLEAVHKVLKHIYMEGKVNKRLDKCIDLLFQLVRGKTFQRFTNLIKGGCKTKLKEINQRHRESKNISRETILVIKDNEIWEVPSTSNSKATYRVEKINASCTDCRIICNACKMCIHSFTCSCVDNIMKMNICKHIHAVCQLDIKPESIPSVCEENEPDLVMAITQSKSFQDYSNSNKIPASDVRVKMQYALSLIPENLTDAEHHQVNLHLDKIINIFSSKGQITEKCKEPANKKIKLQPRFFSTKKKRLQSSALSKPSVEFKNSVIDSAVNGEDPIYIHSTFDHTY